VTPGRFPRPEWLTEHQDTASPASRARTAAFLAEHTGTMAMPRHLDTILRYAADPAWRSSRHDRARDALAWAARDARTGLIPAETAFAALRHQFLDAVTGDTERRRERPHPQQEIAQLEARAVTLADQMGAKDIMDRRWEAFETGTIGPFFITPTSTSPPPPTGTQPVDDHEIGVIDGATFVLDEPVELVARWGKGGDVLWAQGESLLLCGPTGVGKTTLAGQLIAGLIGARPDILGYPVAPAKRILYLALDRPRQIQRALRRLFAPADRAHLAQHLIVRRGPLPADIGRKPELLLELARRHHADVLVVDSLKDAAVKLTDDETGGNINRAIQLCNAADIDVLLLHHQRKSSEGHKPTTIEDVYGSTWITAGAGSVILLWGDPGSELVELSHLKQPAEPVGPLNIEHDHHAGTSRVTRGWDALAYLNSCGPAGTTIAAAAQAHHGAPQTAGKAKWKQTERKLRALVRAGLATATGRPAVGEVGYFYPVTLGTDVRFCMDTPHGPSVKIDIIDNPVDNPMDNP
jgi:replicative DNA helicase